MSSFVAACAACLQPSGFLLAVLRSRVSLWQPLIQYYFRITDAVGLRFFYNSKKSSFAQWTVDMTTPPPAADNSRGSPGDGAASSPSLSPPVDFVVDVIFDLLKGHPNASVCSSTTCGYTSDATSFTVHYWTVVLDPSAMLSEADSFRSH